MKVDKVYYQCTEKAKQGYEYNVDVQGEGKNNYFYLDEAG